MDNEPLQVFIDPEIFDQFQIFGAETFVIAFKNSNIFMVSMLFSIKVDIIIFLTCHGDLALYIIIVLGVG